MRSRGIDTYAKHVCRRRRDGGTRSSCRAPQSAKASFGVFFLIAFSFAPVYAKEKADRHKSFVLAVGCTWVLVCRGRRLRRPAKKHKETFLLVFFSLVRKERKGQKEESIPLLNTFCRLAATGANTLPRPSRYSITMATGSKRSSADSDLLLCHVGLWQTSRFRFGCASVCEYSEIGFILIVLSAYKLPHARLALIAGVRATRARICSASSCDMFARVV